MLTATKDRVLPTTVTGSWPRPSWYTQNLYGRAFSDAMTDVAYREQFVDAVWQITGTAPAKPAAQMTAKRPDFPEATPPER